MKKDKIIKFIKEFISYVIVLFIVELIANKFGWTTTSLIDNIIGLTIGWIIWKILMYGIDNKFHKKDKR